MKDPAKMSDRELRGEVRRHRETLRYIAGGILGLAAKPYIQQARDAVDYEEKRAK